MAKKVIYVPSCHSTNTIAEQHLAEHDIHEGAVIVTDHQTAGKGRLDKSWEGEPGKNLMVSIILKPTFLDLEHQFYLNIFSSLAVNKTVAELGAILPHIKWPNDILVNGRKISGILIKNILKGKKIGSCILGIGLNVNQVKFQNANATSIKNISGKHHDLEEPFTVLMENLERFYLKLRKGEFEKLKQLYHKSMFGLNEELEFETGTTFKGIIRGIDKKGRLIVENDGNPEYFNLNEINYITQPV